MSLKVIENLNKDSNKKSEQLLFISDDSTTKEICF